MKILILNGPNLGRLDIRDSSLYGDLSYSQLVELLQAHVAGSGLDLDIRQSDDEAQIIGWLHEAADSKTPVIFNPAAFTHYSYAIGDAAAMLKAPLIEVHLSNPKAREEFRHLSVISSVATGSISGFGPQSYILALEAMKKLMKI
ncbi:MAG: type II 3-dehydroquinate dehydratase [Actinobacteria bacterium]|uniref:3-dehydroquinate dehydratase n=1 Tax=freshwater metagenome TaxID=449393 RepID=A0A6J7TR54_9ZZZZ|nr:type II 3-dehydroquinate dehydratase [Actinomycetota bacterium]MSX24512.1 type II 3-dehydroquinate dehydratase [Actinomycetota bacterium]MSY46666.1 type II 3-dehydroquinate dehydratase [Actinomycetota bacterium]MTB00196.1 type II 3-dehydroquinate dehydratase [Actinomycetota bacterium]